MHDGHREPTRPIAGSGQPTRSIFVGDLSFFCDEQNLVDLFSRYGVVLSTEVKRGKYLDSLMHGFVEMESTDDARTAILELHDQKFMGRPMR